METLPEAGDESPMSDCGIDALPDGLLRRVFALLPPESLPALRFVSKRWWDVSWSSPLLANWADVHPKNLPTWLCAPPLVRETLLLTLPWYDLLQGPDVDSATLDLHLPSLLRRRVLPSQLQQQRPSWNSYVSTLIKVEERLLLLLLNRTVHVQTLLVHPGAGVVEVPASELPRYLLMHLHRDGAPTARRRMLSTPSLASDNLHRISSVDIWGYPSMSSCRHTVHVHPPGSTRIPVCPPAGSPEPGAERYEWQEERLARMQATSHVTVYLWHRVAHLKAGTHAPPAADCPYLLQRWRPNPLVAKVLAQASARGWLQHRTDDGLDASPQPSGGQLLDGGREVAVGDCLLFAVADSRAVRGGQHSIAALAGVPCDFWKQDLCSLFDV